MIAPFLSLPARPLKQVYQQSGYGLIALIRRGLRHALYVMESVKRTSLVIRCGIARRMNASTKALVHYAMHASTYVLSTRSSALKTSHYYTRQSTSRFKSYGQSNSSDRKSKLMKEQELYYEARGMPK